MTVVRQRTLDFDGSPFGVTYSIGGVFASPSVKLDDVIRQADDALYRAKHAGRDRACLEVLGDIVLKGTSVDAG